MKNLLLSLFALVAVMVIALPAYAERPNKPDRPGGDQDENAPDRGAMAEKMREMAQADPFLANPSEAIKLELKRHAEVQRSLMQKTGELRKTIMEAIRTELEAERKRIAEENPNAENPPKPDLKAIADKVREANKEQIEELCKLLIDENIKHSENMLEIKKKERDEAIKKMAERFTVPREGMRPGEGRPEGGRGEGDGKGEGKGEGRDGKGKGEGRDKPERPPIE